MTYSAFRNRLDVDMEDNTNVDSLNQSLVSIIIPCYNQGQFLEECIASVKKSNYPFLEIIVVDDGSNEEDSMRLFESFPFSDCKLIRQENQGPSAARNRGIAESTGHYVLPLDADDRIGEEYLKEAIEILELNTEIGIVYCEAEFFGLREGRWDLPKYDKDKMLTENLIFNCAMFRRSDFDKTIGFNPNMKMGWEDWDFWLSLIELDLKVYKISSVQFYYRIRSLSRERSLTTEKIRVLRKQIVKNHFELFLNSFSDPISLHFEKEGLRPFKKSFEEVLNSLDYRLGRAILFPIRFIKKIFRK
jgi:glycosyltransferase involved in cell wall biosynthesis